MTSVRSARLKRVQRRLAPSVSPDGIDYSKPPDPLQSAILEEIEAYLSEADLDAPLKYQSKEYHLEMIHICVGRALEAANLSAEQVEKLAPAYEDLFGRYFARSREDE